MIEVLVPRDRDETVIALAHISLSSSEPDFLAQRPESVVLIPPVTDTGSKALFESAEVSPYDKTPEPGFYTLHGAKTPVGRVVDTFREARVAPLTKSARNAFAQMITIGRANNNDIVIAVSTISKLHGYFMPVPSGGMRYFDAGSTNGSAVGGKRLASRTGVNLEDGVEIVLGPDVRLLFRTPAGLYETLKLVATNRDGGAFPLKP